MYVKCGKCEACLQEKANKRASRIRNHVNKDYVILFVTLTYADAYIPYFYKSDVKLNQEQDIKIYRDHECRNYFNTGTHSVCSYSSLYGKQIDTYHNTNCTQSELDRLFDIGFGRVGVLYYKDIQNFFKKLRSNIERDEQFSLLRKAVGDISYFVTGEYGEQNSRPHWHVLLRVPKFEWHRYEVLELWKCAITKSWMYAFEYVTRRRLEIAKNAAKYVSQYVNCSVDISPFLRRDDFRPVWHYSKDFGCGVEAFSIQKVLEALERRDLRYNLQYTKGDGSIQTCAVPFPKYVLNRFFPYFKGRFRLSYEDLTRLLGSDFEPTFYPKRIIQQYDRKDVVWYLDKSLIYQLRCKMDLTDDDIYTIVIRLHNAYNKFHDATGLGRKDYAFYYVRYLELSNRNLWLQQYEDLEQPYDYFQKYDNIKEVFDEKWNLLESFGYWFSLYDDDYITDPNNFERNKMDDGYLRSCYFKYVKTKQVNTIKYA